MSAKIFRGIAGLLTCAVLFSFSMPGPGGEGFEIYLNNKLVMEQFGENMKVVRSLKLDASNANDVMSIRYHHCGQVGKNRVITLRDSRDNILKVWKFTDVKTAAASMTCKVKDILALQKGKDKTIKLYYSSSELPRGRQLASIVATEASVAAK